MDIFLKLDPFVYTVEVYLCEDNNFKEVVKFNGIEEAIKGVNAYCERGIIKTIHLLGDKAYAEGISQMLLKNMYNYSYIPKVEVNQ